MTFDDYASVNAMNWSSLRHLAESPKAYKWWTEHERPDSAAMLLGRAIHCLVLEPTLFHERYVVLPTRPDIADGRAKKGTPEKQAYEDWKLACAAAESRKGEVLSDAESATCARVGDAVASHMRALDIISTSRREVTVTWTDADTGIACKARLDALGGFVADLKTTHKRLDSPRMVAADASRMLYHGQLAYYHDGAIAAGMLPRSAPPPAIIVAQTVAPYDVGVFELDAYALDAGRSLYRGLLRRYVECRDTDWWPGAAPDPIQLSLPPWAPGMAEALGNTETEWPDWADKETE